eukprot:TRINITY_DN7945_c0_g2_i2.p1 TRINITY_DN7945_c0_g2~~TRINITY_DN7945_c0_g2_i2.p1  ORF type:complete len:336 (-),score=50.25 TRINITY_DN7945_c0_g2_i2:93-1100(-)
MRSSATLDACGSAFCAAGAFSLGWSWVGVACTVTCLINIAVKISDLWVARSLCQRVVRTVKGLREKKHGWVAGRNLLVLVNPNAGSGRGGLIFQRCVAPMLDAAHINYRTINTQGSGHACDLCRELAQNDMRLSGDDTHYSMIVCVSGDGMLHEVLRGLGDACSTPEELRTLLGSVALAIVPAGSGNGVAASMRASDPVQAVLNIIQGSPASVDLFSVHRLAHPAAAPTWDVHFFCWAAFSDHDWLTERTFRNLGPLLKMVAAPILVILRARCYRGTVDLLPVDLPSEELSLKHYRDPTALERSPLEDPAAGVPLAGHTGEWLSLIHISEPTRPY